MVVRPAIRPAMQRSAVFKNGSDCTYPIAGG